MWWIPKPTIAQRRDVRVQVTDRTESRLPLLSTTKSQFRPQFSTPLQVCCRMLMTAELTQIQLQITKIYSPYCPLLNIYFPYACAEQTLFINNFCSIMFLKSVKIRKKKNYTETHK